MFIILFVIVTFHVVQVKLKDHLMYELNMGEFHLNVFVFDLEFVDDVVLEWIEHKLLILHLKTIN